MKRKDRHIPMLRSVFVSIGGSLLPFVLQAQNTAPVWIEEVLYSTGKYNTVAAVVGIILVGTGIWLFLQDRRLSALEERIAKRMERP